MKIMVYLPFTVEHTCKIKLPFIFLHSDARPITRSTVWPVCTKDATTNRSSVPTSRIWISRNGRMFPRQEKVNYDKINFKKVFENKENYSILEIKEKTLQKLKNKMSFTRDSKRK